MTGPELLARLNSGVSTPTYEMRRVDAGRPSIIGDIRYLHPYTDNKDGTITPLAVMPIVWTGEEWLSG